MADTCMCDYYPKTGGLVVKIRRNHVPTTGVGRELATLIPISNYGVRECATDDRPAAVVVGLSGNSLMGGRNLAALCGSVRTCRPVGLFSGGCKPA